MADRRGGAAAFVRAVGAADRRCGATGVVLAVAASLTEGVGLLLLVPILSRVGDRGDSSDPSLGTLLVVFVALIGLRALLVRARDVSLLRAQLTFVERTRLGLHETVVGADWPTISALSRAEVLHALTTDMVRIGAGARALMDLVRAVTLIAACFVASLVVSPAASVAATAVGGGLALIAVPLVRRARLLGQLAGDAARRLHSAASDLLDGIKVAKAHAAEAGHAALFKEAVHDQQRAAIGFERARANAAALQQVGAAAASAALVWFAVVELELESGRVIAIVFLLSRLLPLLIAGLQSAQQVANALPSWAAISDLEGRCRSTPAAHAAVRVDLTNLIRLVDVSVGRRLVDVDLELPAGSVTAVVGPSGAGKTTLADVLVGLLEPTRGELRIDGIVLDASTAPSWRQRVAYVPQDPFLFPISIAANMRVTAPDASDDELWSALDAAAASGFVRMLPDGLETVVGERGTLLSGGERQRITLARALVRQPQLLVLDEPTSALDADNDDFVRRQLATLRGRMTIVVIAHRPSTVEGADLVVEIDRGRVVSTRAAVGVG